MISHGVMPTENVTLSSSKKKLEKKPPLSYTTVPSSLTFRFLAPCSSVTVCRSPSASSNSHDRSAPETSASSCAAMLTPSTSQRYSKLKVLETTLITMACEPIRIVCSIPRSISDIPESYTCVPFCKASSRQSPRCPVLSHTVSTAQAKCTHLLDGFTTAIISMVELDQMDLSIELHRPLNPHRAAAFRGALPSLALSSLRKASPTVMGHAGC